MGGRSVGGAGGGKGREACEGPRGLAALGARLREGTDGERALLRGAEALEALLARGRPPATTPSRGGGGIESPPDSPGLTPPRAPPPPRDAGR